MTSEVNHSIMHFSKISKPLVKKFIGLAVILFSVLLAFSAIVYALTTWAPGSAPQAAPGVGNVELGLILETRTSDPAAPETGRIWLRTDL